MRRAAILLLIGIIGATAKSEDTHSGPAARPAQPEEAIAAPAHAGLMVPCSAWNDWRDELSARASERTDNSLSGLRERSQRLIGPEAELRRRCDTALRVCERQMTQALFDGTNASVTAFILGFYEASPGMPNLVDITPAKFLDRVVARCRQEPSLIVWNVASQQIQKLIEDTPKPTRVERLRRVIERINVLIRRWSE